MAQLPHALMPGIEWFSGRYIYGNGVEPHDEFYVGTLDNVKSYRMFTRGGSYSGYYAGDFNNSPSYADTGLVPYPTNSNIGGWGTNFTIQSFNSGEATAFKNSHWDGYMVPGEYSNSDAFYRNHCGQYCFGVYPPNKKLLVNC